MEEAIPISSKSNLPWFNNEIRTAMRQSDTLRSGLSHRYKIARNKIISLLRKVKHCYFHLLNPVDNKEVLGYNYYNPQFLFSNVMKYLMKLMNRRHRYSIPFFNQAHPPSSHPFDQLRQFSSEDMHCTVEEVRDALKGLDITKASEPDHVSARMLKFTANSIAPSITELLICSICTFWQSLL